MRTLCLTALVALGCGGPGDNRPADAGEVASVTDAAADPADTGFTKEVAAPDVAGDAPVAGIEDTVELATNTRLIGTEGGRVGANRLTLVIPAGALDAPTEITVTMLEDVEPDGHTVWSPVFRLEPEDLPLKKPAQVTINYITGWGSAGAVFLSRPDTHGYERLGGYIYAWHVTHPIERFGSVFIGDGRAWAEPPDLDCLRPHLYGPGAAGVLVGVEDCHARPAPALGSDAFQVLEDGAPVDTTVSPLPLEEVAPVVSVLLDLGAPGEPLRPRLIDAARTLVTRLVEDTPGVRVGLSLVTADGAHPWQAPIADDAALLPRLDDLSTAPGAENPDLYGAIEQAATALSTEIEPVGALVVVTPDGADAGATPLAAAQQALLTGRRPLLPVALRQHIVDRAPLQALSRQRLLLASDPIDLSNALEATAHQLRLRWEALYQVSWCPEAGAQEAVITTGGEPTQPWEVPNGDAGTCE